MAEISFLEREAFLNRLKAADTYALGLLQPLINGYPFLPFTGSSLRPYCLAHLLNDILINGRKRIIEFGSGISTVMIGRLIVKNGLDATLLSIEHDAAWAETLSALILNEKLNEVVSVLHVPLTACQSSVENNLWYDTAVLENCTDHRPFDMVIVDGPPAWEPGKGKARYMALPFMIDKLAPRFSIYLDDANRPGERSVIQLWQSQYDIQFTISGQTMAFHYGGQSFYTEPQVYY